MGPSKLSCKSIHCTLLTKHPTHSRPSIHSDRLDGFGSLWLFRLSTVTDHCMRGLVDLDLALIDSHFVCVAEDCGNLFEWHTSSIREKDPDHNSADTAWNDECEVELPSNVAITVSEIRKKRRSEHHGMALRECRGRRLQPDNVHQGDHRNAQ